MRRDEIRPGDRVRIREWHDMAEEYGVNDRGSIRVPMSFTASMRYLCGEEFTVESISVESVTLRPHPASTRGHNWYISPEMLEPAVCDATNVSQDELLKILYL